MERLSKKNILFIGLTFFSMFFGAGNLIFPPFLGQQAGGNAWLAMAGFAISAVGFPVLGVIAVARSGGLKTLAGRVSAWFASAFTLLIYLSIGPCLAIPRTASTSFEMAVLPFLKGEAELFWPQLLYSLVFFAVALLLALRPDKLTDRLGKILCPTLLFLILVIFLGCVFHPVGSYGLPTADYVNNALSQGFLAGYQTMDTMAALIFGLVIALNIRARRVQEDGAVVRGMVQTGLIAGLILLLVYGALLHIGALSGGAFEGATNGAQTLSNLVSALFGSFGSILLAAVFAIACLNTCIGLIACCGEYFNEIFPKIPYKAWACVFAAVSMLISNLGLDRILAVSVPILNTIYPVAIVLIVLSFFQRFIKQNRAIDRAAILFTFLSSLISVLDKAHLALPLITGFFRTVPLYEQGMGWILPALFGVLIGWLFSLITKRTAQP